MESIKENWEKMAEAYDAFISPEDSFSNAIELPCLLSLIGDVKGKRVLEVGCGAGRLAFHLESGNPERIDAVDLSEEMIQIAKKAQINRGSNVHFHCGDIGRLAFLEDQSVDCVVASTVFHFVERLDETMFEISRVLRVGGRAVFSLIHPVHSALYPICYDDGVLPSKDAYKLKYQYRDKRAYVQPWIAFNPNIEDFLCYSYHHTLEDYFKVFSSADLVLEQLREPEPPETWAQSAPSKYHAYKKAPNYLVLQLKKQPSE